MTQQEKMKVCNTRAGDKKGDERKAFMSECLKGRAARVTIGKHGRVTSCPSGRG